MEEICNILIIGSRVYAIESKTLYSQDCANKKKRK